MAPSTHVRPLGWTRRIAATTMLAALAEQRAQSAARLTRAIDASGKSFETIAYEAGVSVKTISRWANQHHDPSRTTVKGVAKALDVDPDWLWTPPEPMAIGHGREDQVAELTDQLQTLTESVTYLTGLVNILIADRKLQTQAARLARERPTGSGSTPASDRRTAA